MSRLSRRTPAFLGYVPKLIKDWSASAAIGTFLLYLFGYLSLRFHMTVLGVTTDLSALDERYLFAGARFLVFFGSCLPYVGVAAALLGGAWVLVWRALPQAARNFLSRPSITLTAGLAFALVMVFVMRSCFALTRSSLPFLATPLEPRWLESVLRGSDEVKALYFTALVLAAAIPCALLAAATRAGIRASGERAMAAALAVLALVMILLLPVNHGTLLAPYQIHRTNAVGKTPVAAGQKAWVLWEGKDRVSYLLKSGSAVSIVSVPWKLVERLEIAGSDSLRDVVLSTSAPAGPAMGPATDEPWWQKTARVLGMGNTALGIKGGLEETPPGDIWVASTETGPASKPRAVGAFRWPIVQPGQGLIFAMRDDTLVRMPVAGGPVESVAMIPKVRRLVGFDPSDDVFLALLSGDDRHFDAVFFSASGQQRGIAGQHIDIRDEHAGALLSDSHTYGDVTVTSENGKIAVDKQTVDYCSPGKCSQPSYWPEKKLVVYVKTVK